MKHISFGSYGLYLCFFLTSHYDLIANNTQLKFTFPSFYVNTLFENNVLNCYEQEMNWIFLYGACFRFKVRVFLFHTLLSLHSSFLIDLGSMRCQQKSVSLFLYLHVYDYEKACPFYYTRFWTNWIVTKHSVNRVSYDHFEFLWKI